MTDVSRRSPIAAGLLRGFFLVSLVAAFWGCYRDGIIQVETRVEAISASYLLRITNETGEEIRIRPNSTGESKGFPLKVVRQGQSFDIELQLRKLKVGADAETPTHEVISTPYMEMAGQPNMARIFVEHGPQFGETYDLDIDLASSDWLKSRESEKPELRTLIVKLTSFTKDRWFRHGPGRP